MFTRIAAAAGVSRKTVQRIADDVTYNPTLATFKNVYDAARKFRPKAKTIQQ